MAKITFLGGEETGNVAFVDWLGVRFHVNQAVECSNPHIIAKARGNRFYKVDGAGTIPPAFDRDAPGTMIVTTAEPVTADALDPPRKADPLAKARAAKAAKRAAAETA